jgi:hypothetical protein
VGLGVVECFDDDGISFRLGQQSERENDKKKGVEVFHVKRFLVVVIFFKDSNWS